VANPLVFWCPSDLTNAPPAGIPGTNSFTSSSSRYLVWQQSCQVRGLRMSLFAEPSMQMIYHETSDNHFHRMLPPFSSQPRLIAVAGDGHAQKWKIIFRQNVAGNYYDPNWFSYGSRGQLNTGVPNIGGDVRTGYDNL
jgi:hypothetical protein